MITAAILAGWLVLAFVCGYAFGTVLRQRASEMELPDVEIIERPE